MVRCIDVQYQCHGASFKYRLVSISAYVSNLVKEWLEFCSWTICMYIARIFALEMVNNKLKLYIFNGIQLCEKHFLPVRLVRHFMFSSGI